MILNQLPKRIRLYMQAWVDTNPHEFTRISQGKTQLEQLSNFELMGLYRTIRDEDETTIVRLIDADRLPKN